MKKINIALLSRVYNSSGILNAKLSYTVVYEVREGRKKRRPGQSLKAS